MKKRKLKEKTVKEKKKTVTLWNEVKLAFEFSVSRTGQGLEIGLLSVLSLVVAP